MLAKLSLVLLLGPCAALAQLNSLAVAAGLEYFGTAVGEGNTGDSRYMSIIADTREFGQVVPENGQKWQNTQPQRGTFSYSQGDIVRNAPFLSFHVSHVDS